MAVHLSSRRAPRVHLWIGVGLHARAPRGLASTTGSDSRCAWLADGSGSCVAVVVRRATMARRARRQTARPGVRLVSVDRVHDRFHRTSNYCFSTGASHSTKMSPAEDGSTEAV